MGKKLNNLYIGKIEKRINNNEAVFYSVYKREMENVNKMSDSSLTDDIDIESKITALFNSPNYVYKLRAIIELKDNTTIDKEIIGRKNGKLITIDDDLVNINDIRNIIF